jgi:formylglycine-generating enzyme required for sulfatase activity
MHFARFFGVRGALQAMGIAFLVISSAFAGEPAAKGDVAALFGQMEKDAKTPDQKLEAAKTILAKAEDFPAERAEIAKRAIRLALASKKEEAVEFVGDAYALLLEKKAAPEDKVLRGWIADVKATLDWKVSPETKRFAAKNLVDVYEKLGKSLESAGRSAEAQTAADEELKFLSANAKLLDNVAEAKSALVSRQAAIKETAEAEKKLAKLLEDAKDEKNAAANLAVGMHYLAGDQVLKAIPYLERGGKEAEDALKLARLVKPLTNRKTPGGLTQAMIDGYEEALRDGAKPGTLEKWIDKIICEPALKEKGMKIQIMRGEKEDTAALAQEFLEETKALLAEKAEPVLAQVRLDAAKGYEELAMKDPKYGDKGMALANRAYLAKAVQHYKAFADAAEDKEGKDAKFAALKAEMMEKKLAAAGGYLTAAKADEPQESGSGGGQYLAIDLSAGPSAKTYGIVNLGTCPKDLLTNTTGPNGANKWKTTHLVLRKIKAGTFVMGSPENELGRADPGGEAVRIVDETQHTVTLTKDYYIGVFEVTQAQYELVMGENPSLKSRGAMYPVDAVGWDKARGGPAIEKIGPKGLPGPVPGLPFTFLGRLSDRTGLRFDLPTEAQWEYACRAGTTTALNNGKNLTQAAGSDAGLDEVGWYDANAWHAGSQTHPVGLKKPNAWGLYDMHGNVWEWCLDFAGDYPKGAVTDPEGPGNDGAYQFVYRGGTWYWPPRFCRSAVRFKMRGTLYMHADGFRAAMLEPRETGSRHLSP